MAAAPRERPDRLQRLTRATGQLQRRVVDSVPPWCVINNRKRSTMRGEKRNKQKDDRYKRSSPSPSPSLSLSLSLFAHRLSRSFALFALHYRFFRPFSSLLSSLNIASFHPFTGISPLGLTKAQTSPACLWAPHSTPLPCLWTRPAFWFMCVEAVPSLHDLHPVVVTSPSHLPSDLVCHKDYFRHDRRQQDARTTAFLSRTRWSRLVRLHTASAP
jgi:hypothetical protein